MADIAKLILDADTRGLKRGETELDRLGNQSRKTAREVDEGAGRMRESFNRVGLAVAGAATAAIGYFGKQAIQVAMDAQEMQSAFEVVFGNMSADMRAWAEATGDAMGRSTQEIQRGAMAFQELFGKALDPAKAAEMSKQFAVLTQDLASFKNLSNEVAQQKLFSGLIGEAEPLRAVGVFLDEAALKSRAAAMGLGDFSKELSAQEKIVVRAAEVQAQLAAANGDVLRTQDSATNTIRAAQAAYEELQVTVGNALLPTFTALANEVVGGINTLNSLTSTLGITASGISTLISVVKTAVVGWVAYRGTLLAVQAATVLATAAAAAHNSVLYNTVGVAVLDARNTAGATAAKIAYAGATAGATTAARGLIATLAANPFGAVAVVVGTLSAAMFGLAESQRAARAETNALISSLRGLAQARSADYAAKRAEAVAEQSRLEGEILRIEAAQKTGKGTLLGRPSKVGTSELYRLRQELVKVNGELRAADNAFKVAGEAANAMAVPVAGVAKAIGAVGGGGGGGGAAAATPKIDQFAQSLQAVLDKAFPQKAALAEVRGEIDLLSEGYRRGKIALEDYFKGASNLWDEYADRFYGKIEPISSLPEMVGLDPDWLKKFNEKSLAELDKFATKSGTAAVRIEKTFKDMADGILGSLQGLVNGIKGGGFLDILGGVIDLLLQLGSAGAFGSKIQTNINKPIDGARANGGPVTGGKTYLVGERGPELFTAPGTGKIVSNDNLKGMGASRVEVVPSPYFNVVVDGRIVQAAPAVANAGAQLAQGQLAQRAGRRIR